MGPLEQDRLAAMLEKIAERLGSVERGLAVIQDQNVAQFREIEEIKGRLFTLTDRWNERHVLMEKDRRLTEGALSERLQRLETMMWLVGSTVSVLALFLGGGVLVKFIGG